MEVEYIDEGEKTTIIHRKKSGEVKFYEIWINQLFTYGWPEEVYAKRYGGRMQYDFYHDTIVLTVWRGNKVRKEQREHSRLHRDCGPAVVKWVDDEIVHTEHWHDGQRAEGINMECRDYTRRKYGQYASSDYNNGYAGSSKEYKDGIYHNDCGPALTSWAKRRGRAEHYYLYGVSMKQNTWRILARPPQRKIIALLPNPIAREILHHYCVH
jgi:hypothetical protein